MLRNRRPEYDNITTALKERFLSGKIQGIKTGMTKVIDKVTTQEAQVLLKKNIAVLLYDLSKKQTKRELVCDGGCKVLADGKNIQAKKITVSQ
jgi:archaeosine-15-forming tRNA-guanine transglycosylase